MNTNKISQQLPWTYTFRLNCFHAKTEQNNMQAFQNQQQTGQSQNIVHIYIVDAFSCYTVRK